MKLSCIHQILDAIVMNNTCIKRSITQKSVVHLDVSSTPIRVHQFSSGFINFQVGILIYNYNLLIVLDFNEDTCIHMHQSSLHQYIYFNYLYCILFFEREYYAFLIMRKIVLSKKKSRK